MKKFISLLFIIFSISLSSCSEPKSNSEPIISESEITEPSESDVSSEESPSEPTESEPSEPSESEEPTESESNSELDETSESEVSSEPSEVIYVTAYFYNERTLLYYDEVEVGTTPIYEGEIPTKESDYTYNYTFSGWDKELEPIYEDTFYYAQFEKEQYFYLISEILEWNIEKDEPQHLGKEIYFEDVVITSVYSDNQITIEMSGGYIDYSAIDVFTKESIYEIYTERDIVSVRGIVGEYQNRSVIIEAEISWGTYGEEDSDDQGSYGQIKLDDREEFLTFGREESGQIYYSNFQIASLPTVVPNQELEFYVTFPGEDISINENNYYLIKMVIPALKEEQVEKVNEKISILSVGCAATISFQPTYNDKMYGVLTFNRIDTPNSIKVIELDNIYNNYVDINSILLEEYDTDKLLDLSHQSIYNFSIKEKWEKYGYTSRICHEIEAYSYSYDDVYDTWLNLYNTDSNWINSGVIEGEQWFKSEYGSETDICVSFLKGFGKCVLTVHIREKVA